MTDQAIQRDQNKSLHMASLEAQEQLDRVTAGGRVPQDVAIAALKEVEGLRYEYAAQVWRPLLNKWLFMGSSGLWEHPRRARWYMSPLHRQTHGRWRAPRGASADCNACTQPASTSEGEYQCLRT